MEVRKYTKTHTNANGGTVIIRGGQNNYNSDVLNVVTLNASNINAKNIKCDNMKTTNIDAEYIKVNYGEIDTVISKNLGAKYGNISDLTSDNINTRNLDVSDTANINQLIANKLTSTNIVTDYLTVNKSAHFFELVIDKMRSVQGTQMNTAANCAVGYSEARDTNENVLDLDDASADHYRIYWKTTDDDGKAITNDWLPNDQAICQSFNIKPGTSYDTKNKYYWRLVEKTSNDTGEANKYVNLNTKYNFDDKVLNSEHDFEIVFSNMIYGDGTDDFDNFIITPDFIGEWNTDTWTPSSPQFGLKIKANEGGDVDLDDPTTIEGAAALIDGTFSFDTDIMCSFNIAVIYEDGSVDFHEARDTDGNLIYGNSYQITTSSDKYVNYIWILTNTIERWDECYWIDLSNTDYDVNSDQAQEVTRGDLSGIPTIGDNVCQLGYRFSAPPTQDEKTRSGAIIIAAYQSPDSQVVPPSYAQYQYITDYNLSSHRKTFFDATQAQIIGKFKVDASGQEVDLDQYIQSQTQPQEATIIVESNNAVVDMCIMQVDANDKIYDLNNLPGTSSATTPPTRFMYISIYTDQSYYPVYVNCDLFGRTVTIMDINPDTGLPRLLPTADTANGIYVHSVTTSNDKLCVTFAFRGTEQVIENGSSIQFYGQVILNRGTAQEKTINPSQTITIAAVKNMDGTDGESFTLLAGTEKAILDSNNNLVTTLNYKVAHVIGGTSYIETPSSITDKLRITKYDSSGNTIGTAQVIGTTYYQSNGWTWTDNKNNWYNPTDMSGSVFYYKVELIDSTEQMIFDSRIVNVQINTMSLFVVQDDLTQSIQGNTNSISSITQWATGINLSINTINSDISDLGGDINDINNGLIYTGIDITTGNIVLDAAKTTVTGDLNIGGYFESYNPTTGNRTKINTKASGQSGLTLSGPNLIDEDTGLPEEGAVEVNLLELDFGNAFDRRSGQIQIYDAADPTNNNLFMNSANIIMNNSNGNVSITPNGLGAKGYGKEWEDLLLNRKKILYIPDGSAYHLGQNYGDILYDMIFIDTSNDFKLYFPDPRLTIGGRHTYTPWEGKQIIVKKGAGGDLDVKIEGNLKLIMSENNHELQDEDDIDDVSMMYFCAGGYWIAYWCK